MIAAQQAAFVAHTVSFPEQGFSELRAEGLLHAPLTEQWGRAPGTFPPMMDTLRRVGARDLSLGRLYEGHVNALMLIGQLGDVALAQTEVQAGRIYGVWNTDAADGVHATRRGDWLELTGRKAFGSGAGSVLRPIVTAEIAQEGRVMCVLPMERTRHTIDFDSWHPLGMHGSDSFTVDFTGAVVPGDVVLGRAGDYYRQPAFSGGAIRFAAVQLGAAERLADDFTIWLRERHRTADPFQQVRAGEIAIAVQSGRQWIQKAAVEAERYFYTFEQSEIAHMVHFANMTRLAIERICLDVMERVTRGVGARGLLAPATFERQIRDLTMYLRQPAPDQALAEVGRAVLEP